MFCDQKEGYGFCMQGQLLGTCRPVNRKIKGVIFLGKWSFVSHRKVWIQPKSADLG